MAYKDKVKNFNSDLLSISRKLIDNKIYRQNKKTQKIMMEKWLEKASEIENVDIPNLILEDEDDAGHYSQLTQTISLPKTSLVTLFHEFRHHVLCERQLPSTEKEARSWSVSLFYKISPSLYYQAVKKGILYFK